MKRKLTIIIENDKILQITLTERGKKTKLVNPANLVAQISSTLHQATTILNQTTQTPTATSTAPLTASPIHPAPSSTTMPTQELRATEYRHSSQIVIDTPSISEETQCVSLLDDVPRSICARPKPPTPKPELEGLRGEEGR